MKLNFWQWLGVVLIIIAVVLIVRKRIATTDVVNTQPTTAPAADR